ncbi:unnamed protein product [Urochloa decumbens]|uniref:non-specific serine/threonine protein kinase n=1 Tax=Urochloa decumbens TaxID=240449 RepID=A0ABC9B0X0_9POAL
MERLEEWLAGDAEQQLRVMSIVGLGGIGKTTLAKEMYYKLGRQFDCRAFARSSQKPDMKMLLTSILLQVRQHLQPEDSELCNLADTIRAHLHHKKYFIIIDDLWASSTWDIIRQAFPDDKCCSRILITTENGVAAQRCCGYNSEHIFKMDPLRDNQSRKLFFSIVQSNQSENHEQFNKISYDIIRKCGGFPLATVTTAGLLATKKKEIEQCNYIRRSLSSNLQSNPTLEGMNEVLLFCYNNLPAHLQACILYLSIYKEDHIILKDDLVKQWVAEGFICAQEGKDMEEVARTYFNELVNAGMIHPVDIKYNGEVLSCNVHYMILNIIRYKSVEENFVTAIDHTQTNLRLADKVRRLSLNFGDAEDAVQPENLRLLQILCNVTLDLQNQMQGLLYMETLKIDSRVNEVPPDIVHLPGLLHLSLLSDTKLPNGIGCMASLQTLGCIDLSRNSEENLIGLGELANLRDLHLACSTTSDNLVKNLQHLGSVLSKLSNLRSLTLLHAGSSNANILETWTSRKNISCEFGSMSSPPALLQELKLLPRVCVFSLLPKWIGKLRLLSILKIEIVALFSEDVDILKGLPVLTDLSLYVHTTPAQRIIFDKEGFSVLKYLKFICATPFIAFMEGAMPTVQRLKLGFSVSTMRQFNPIDIGLKHMTGLEVFFAKIGGAGPDDESGREAANFLVNAAFTNHPSPPVINIEWVEFILDRETEKQADSRIILPMGPSSHMKDQEPSSLMQKPVEEDKKPRTQKENYQIIKEEDVIVEEDTDEPHGIEVNRSGEVTSKHDATRNSMASSSHMQKPEWRPWHARFKYSRITGIFSKIGGKDGNRLISCSSQDSAVSMPPNVKTECDILQSANVKTFSFNNLKAATRNFDPDGFLGEGGFGSVYKGWIHENTLEPCRPGTGIAVAVKRLNLDSWQGHREWLAEVNYLGHFCHPNIVKLIGHCLEDEQRLLVYEFMPRGSLGNHLFRGGSYLQTLSWNLRMKIALGAGKGLAYIHNKIIHRNFKTSNILLDIDYCAKLSGFGLAKDGPGDEESHVSTRVIGTYGYAAPEYIATGHLTAKCDVYSFGVVLLEMLSGRRALDPKRPQGEHNLVEWARPYLAHKRKIFRVLDTRLEGQYSLNGAQTIATLALECLSNSPKKRPCMDAVVTILEELQDKFAEKHQELKAATEHTPTAVSGSKSSRKPC